MRACGRIHTWCHAGQTGSSRRGVPSGAPRRPGDRQEGLMAGLKDKLRSDLTAAMKARDKLRTRTLRMALTSVSTAEVAGKAARELDDEEILKVRAREAKPRREAAGAFEAAGRGGPGDEARPAAERRPRRGRPGCRGSPQAASRLAACVCRGSWGRRGE